MPAVREGPLLLATSVVLLLLPSAAGAVVIRVPDEQPTIQAGIDAASEGDTVLVAPGEYTGQGNRNLDFGGTNLVLRSEDGPEGTTIDCEGATRGFCFEGYEDATSVVEGFTITRAHGSALYCMSGAPTVVECVFHDNEGDGGAAAYCLWYSAAFVGCEFYDNVATYSGGAIYIEGAQPLITDCVFHDNEAGTSGGAIRFGGWGPGGPGPTITHCTFYGNTAAKGGGVYAYALEPYEAITNCTFYLNTGTSAGGGIYCQGDAHPGITRTIIAFSEHGGSVACSGISNPTISNCCLFANTGGDSACGDSHDNLMHIDPLFCERDVWDLTLCTNSPCLPGNNPWGIVVGAHETGCGDCVSVVERATWGTVKSMFR